MAEPADPPTNTADTWFMTCVVKAFAPLLQYGFCVVTDRPRGPSPRDVIYTNGSASIIAGLNWLEGELLIEIERPDHPTVHLVDLLDDRTARSLHLRHLPRTASKGVITSRLNKAARAIENHLPQLLIRD